MVNFGLLTAEIGWRVVGTPLNFQRVSHIGFVTALTSLNAGQPTFARCLAVSWAGPLYIHFWGLLPPNGILPSTIFVQVLRSPALAALLHCTRAASVSQNLRHAKRNGIAEL